MKDQQGNAAISITVGLVEDVLVIVILGEGLTLGEETGWAGTAGKLAENVEPRPGVSQIYFKIGLLIINEPLFLLCKIIKTSLRL